jgi:hypothetical protein
MMLSQLLLNFIQFWYSLGARGIAPCFPWLVRLGFAVSSKETLSATDFGEY